MIKPEGEEDRGQGDVRRVRPYILHANKQHNEHYTKNNVLDTLFHNFPSLNHSSFFVKSWKSLERVTKMFTFRNRFYYPKVTSPTHRVSADSNDNVNKRTNIS